MRYNPGHSRLTSLQIDVLIYMREFFVENQQLPTMDCIRLHFGWASANNSQEHIDRLTAKGFLTKNVVGKNKFTPLALDLFSVVTADQASV